MAGTSSTAIFLMIHAVVVEVYKSSMACSFFSFGIITLKNLFQKGYVTVIIHQFVSIINKINPYLPT